MQGPAEGVSKGPFLWLGRHYVDAVERAGGRPAVVAPGLGAPDLTGFAGLVLTGGEDLDPARYGEAPDPALGDVSPERDAHELALFAEARRLGLPVLAICRGCQLVNVALGGTLYQDLPTGHHGRPSLLPHRQAEPWDATSHPVGFAPSRLLGRCPAGVAPDGTVRVNSFHHQAVKVLAAGLVPLAEAPDGVFEAFEAQEGWVLGVQWHPERTSGRDALSDAIFSAFVAACGAPAAV